MLYCCKFKFVEFRENYFITYYIHVYKKFKKIYDIVIVIVFA